MYIVAGTAEQFKLEALVGPINFEPKKLFSKKRNFFVLFLKLEAFSAISKTLSFKICLGSLLPDHFLKVVYLISSLATKVPKQKYGPQFLYWLLGTGLKNIREVHSTTPV